MDQTYVAKICQGAKDAWPALASAGNEIKDRALLRMASLLELESTTIEAANTLDLEAGRKAGLSTALLDRLALNKNRIAAMCKGLHEVSALPHPVGHTYDRRVRPNGLEIYKVRVPLGVILMIYESRPNVTVDAAALCLKTGNCVLLRGGKEALHSNSALAHLFQQALRDTGLPGFAVQLVETADRAVLDELLRQDSFINLVIPRGGEGLIRTVAEKSRIPTIKHYKGVCHVYIDKDADLAKATSVALNAKIQRPAVCNAMETLLIHKALPESFMAGLLQAFLDQKVEIRGCPNTCRICSRAKPATEEDWYAEYLDLVLAVKIVDGLDAAVAHIARYGSQHTDAIITENKKTAEEFVCRVDSASVMVNASTRFSDGGEYGLGAEIGISTDKLHARGPMGLEELTTYKWVVIGNGQVRA